MNVVLPSGKTVQGLTLKGLAGHTKRQNVALDSITLDRTPRRVLLVLDMGGDLSAQVRQSQLEVASYLVNEGRKEDFFGLITARGASRKVNFDQGRDTLNAAFTELRNMKAMHTGDDGILDALKEGADWFQNPQPGDAIIAMASELEKTKSTSYTKVANTLAQKHIRLFSISVGPMISGTYFTPMDPFSRHNEGNAFAVNQESLSSLTWNSGGYMVVEYLPKQVDSVLDEADRARLLKEYKLDDEHRKKLLDEAAQIYIAIATFYRLNVQLPADLKHREEWQLDLTDDIRKKIPSAFVAYPRLLEPCTVGQSGLGK